MEGLSALSINWRDCYDIGQLKLMPGGLSSTLYKTAIPDYAAQSCLNVNVDRGIWELDDRYRQWQPAPVTTGGGGGSTGTSTPGSACVGITAPSGGHNESIFCAPWNSGGTPVDPGTWNCDEWSGYDGGGGKLGCVYSVPPVEDHL